VKRSSWRILLCRNLRRRIENAFRAMRSNDDDLKYRVSRRVLEGGHRFVETGIIHPVPSTTSTHAPGSPRPPRRSETPAQVFPIECASPAQTPVDPGLLKNKFCIPKLLFVYF
jgi:hypothetical protein